VVADVNRKLKQLSSIQAPSAVDLRAMRRIRTGGRPVAERRKPGCLVVRRHGQRSDRGRAAHDAPIREGEMTRQIRCDIEVEILTGGAGRGIACSDVARAADVGAGARLCKGWVARTKGSWAGGVAAADGE